MTVSYFVIYEGSASAAFADYYLDRHVPLVRRFPGLRALSVLTPMTHRDPYLVPEAGPLLVTHMTFDDVAALENAALSQERMAARADVANFPPFQGSVTHQALRDEYLLPDPATPGGSGAPVCFFVTYQRPAADEATFVDFYRGNHLPLLTRFPRIREAAMFTPVDWRDRPFVTRGDLMVVNLTAFDSAGDFEAALTSEARKDIRADFAKFPPFTGRCTHVSMSRRRFLP
jgi:uncharacterized protein (TIGR02118 family)